MLSASPDSGASWIVSMLVEGLVVRGEGSWEEGEGGGLKKVGEATAGARLVVEVVTNSQTSFPSHKQSYSKAPAYPP